jgi:hypothetical protein
MSNITKAPSRAPIMLASLLCLGLAACHNDDDTPPPSGGDTGMPVSIGGTVAGATGALSLQNSNGNTLNVAADGPFTFSTQMSLGATYNVTVQVPPPSQTCTVANGSGTIGNAAITNIAVTCTTNKYTLGGTLSGLGAGKTLDLRAPQPGAMNGLILSANGAFTFPETLTNNTEYDVSVFAQPQNQVCTVTNGHDAVSGANVTNITVTCVNSSASARNWGNPATLRADGDTTDLNFVRTPDIAFDGAGNALAIWTEDRVGLPGSELYVSRHVAGAGWGAPTMLFHAFPDLTDTQIRERPRIAVAANGNAAAVWVENYLDVAVSLYTPSSGWSDPQVLFDGETNVGNGQPGDAGTVHPKVAIDENGNVLVVWEDYVDKIVGHLKFDRYTPGIGWMSPQQSSLVGGTFAPGRDLQLAMLPNGSAVALWKQDGNGPFDQSQLWASRYDMAGNTWTAPQAVDTQDAGNPLHGKLIPYRTNIVMEPSGTATAVWSQYDGTRLQIVFNRLTGNTWGTPAIIETDTTPDSNAYDPRASIDGNGNIMAMWLQVDNDAGHYVANRYVPGTGWGTRQNIGEYVPIGHVANETSFELVSNAAGDTVAVWTLVSGIGEENVPFPVYLSANEYNPATNSWGVEEVIDRNDAEPGDTGSDAMTPSLAVDASGNAMAVWLQDNSTIVEGLRFNRFE